MGLMWGLFSVIIASVAQLSLGFAASHLPPMTHLWDFIAALLAFGLDARILLLGLLGYLLSVFCWYKTLHKLALSKASPSGQSAAKGQVFSTFVKVYQPKNAHSEKIDQAQKTL